MRKPKVFYGWIVCLAAFGITAACGFYYTYSVFFDPWIAEFGWNREQIASIYSIFPILYSASVIPLGRLTDRYGPQKVIALGAIFFASGIGLCSRANSIGELRLFFSIIASVGASALYVPPMYCVQNWFVKRRGLAVGIVASGVGLGALIFPPLATYLIEIAGWRTTCLLFGLGLGILLLGGAAIIRPKPGDKGLKPHGCKTGKESRDAKATMETEGLTVDQALKTSSFWLLYFPYTFGLACYTLVIVHIVPYAGDIGIPRLTAAGALSLLGAFSLIGRIAMGGISDSLGRKRGLVICHVLIAIAMLGFLVTRQTWMLYLSAGVLGLAGGGFIAQYAAITGDYFGRACLGTILAIVTTAFGVGGATGSYMGGAIFEHTGSYYSAFLICIALALLAAMGTIPLKPPRDQAKAVTPSP